jgi:hypothetical protein
VEDAVLYYLNWDREDDNTGPASTLFHELHVDEAEYESFTATEFEDLYREVAELETNSDDPEDVWRQWNTGSGQESQQYLDLHYCEPCDEYIDTPGEAEVHARDRHDYDPLKPTLPKYIHGERSMSVGDVVQDRAQGEYHMAQPIGFEEITVLEEDRGETL